MSSTDQPAPHSASRDLTYPWWLIAALVLIFALVAAIAAGSNTLSIDQRASEWVQDLGEWSTTVANIGNFLGETPYALGLLAVALIATLASRNSRLTWFLVLAAIGRVAAMVLKGIFDSPRPTEAQVTLAEHFDGYGFPSGHATTSAVLMGTLAFLAASFVPGTAWRWGMVAIAALGVVTTAFARIDVGAHWLTDTIGGALVGTVIVLVAANGSALILNRGPKSASPPQSGQTPAR